MEEKGPEERYDDEPRMKADRALFIQELLMGTLGDFDIHAINVNEDIVLQNPPPLVAMLERENSTDSLASSCNFSTTATMGSSRAGSEFAFPVQTGSTGSLSHCSSQLDVAAQVISVSVP